MFTLIRKEIKSFFDHPTAYILLVVFLSVNSFFFFRSAFAQGVASLWPMFNFLPWIILFFVPAVTMRLIAEERRLGTFDLLMLQPYSLWQLLLAKIISGVIFLSIALAFTFIIPLSLSGFGSFDWGQVLAQYVAVLFLVSALCAIGIFSSSISKNQVVSFIVALGVSFFFIISGLEVVVFGLSGLARTIFEQLALLTHYDNMARGVIDSRDLIYFISFIFSFLALAYYLLRRTYANKKCRGFRQLKTGVIIIVVFSIALNLAGWVIPGRIDFTKNKLYTLAPGTKQLLGGLDEVVTIQFFSSKELPPQVSLIKRDVLDILKDFERKSHKKVQVRYITLSPEDEKIPEAQKLGIVPVQFNVLESQALSLSQGYFGLSVHYGDKREVIPFIEDTSQLEYTLASFIYTLTLENKKTIGFLSGHGEKGIFRDMVSLRNELEKQYVTKEVYLVENQEMDEGAVPSVIVAKDIDDDIDVLVVAGPTQTIRSEEREKIKAFIDTGKAVLFLIDALNVNPQYLSASVNENSLADFVAQYAVRVNPDLVFDVRSNENVSFGGGMLTYVLPYPFWPRVRAVENNPVSGDVESIVLPWASSLTIENLPTDAKAIEIFKTTPFSGVQTSDFNITPDQDFSVTASDVQERLVAASVTMMSGGRIFVVGDSDFLSEQFVRGGGVANLMLSLNAIDWLAQDETLMGIRSKSRQSAPLVFRTENQPQIVRFVNLIGVPLAVVLYALWHLWRRKKKTQKRLTL